MDTRARIGMIALADALLLVVGVVGLATVRADEAKPATDVAAGSSTTAAPSATTAPTASPTTAAVAAGGAKTSVAGKAGTTTTAKAAAAGAGGPGKPPRDGTYRTRTKGEFSGPQGGDTFDQVTSSTYKTVKSTPAETEQTVTSKGDKGEGGTQTTLWRPDGVYHRGVGGSGGGASASCKPDEQLDLRLPLAVGVTWTATVDCTFSGQGGSGKTHVESRSKVVGQKTATVGGRQVSVWEIATTAKSTSTFSGGGQSSTADGTTDMTRLFAPDHGLTVHTESSSTTTSSFGGGTSKATSDLESLDPA